MRYFLQNDKNEWVRAVNNPILYREDGKVKAPLKTILAESWTDKERAAFGVYPCKDFVVPEGKQRVGDASYELVDGTVIETYVVEDIPEPIVEPEPTVSEVFEKLGVTKEELRAFLGLK